jgi:hypothetical protein
VAGIQIEGGCSGGPPLQGTFFALLAPGCAGDQADELGRAGCQQGPWVGVVALDEFGDVGGSFLRQVMPAFSRVSTCTSVQP